MEGNPILAALTLKTIDLYLIPLSALGFYCFYRLLAAKVFTPYLAHLAEREAATVGVEDSVEAIVEETRVLTQKYEGTLSELRASLMKEKLAKVAAGHAIADEKVKEAEAVIHREVSEAKEAIKKERRELQARLEQDAKELAASIISKVESSGIREQGKVN